MSVILQNAPDILIYFLGKLFCQWHLWKLLKKALGYSKVDFFLISRSSWLLPVFHPTTLTCTTVVTISMEKSVVTNDHLLAGIESPHKCEQNWGKTNDAGKYFLSGIKDKTFVTTCDKLRQSYARQRKTSIVKNCFHTMLQFFRSHVPCHLGFLKIELLDFPYNVKDL